jgi:hypothetical protein
MSPVVDSSVPGLSLELVVDEFEEVSLGGVQRDGE